MANNDGALIRLWAKEAEKGLEAIYSTGYQRAILDAIKLLESQLGAYENTPTVTPDFGLEVAINLVKALIHGEQK